MNKIAIKLLAVVLSLLAILLIAPSFIDWTNYRNAFEERLAAATGRAVTIQGDVVLSLLPRPAFQVDAVRISNSPGAVNADFVSAQRVAVNLAFAPLLSGRLQFTSIDVIAPNINAEVLADGSVTWNFVPLPASSRTASGNTGVGDEAFDLGIDKLRVSNGSVRYFDVRSGIEQTFSGITLELEAEHAFGPYDVAGEVYVFSLPWQVDLSVGEIRGDRPSALVVSLSNTGTELSIDFSGALSLGRGNPEISGRFSGSGESLSNVLRILDVIEAGQMLPLVLQDNFRVGAMINFHDSSIEAQKLEMRVGDISSRGFGSYSWNEEARFVLNLAIAQLNLEAWNFSQIPLQNSIVQPSNKGELQTTSSRSTRPFLLPASVSGKIDFGINLIEWRGQVMRNAQFSAALNDSEFTVAEASLDLPGNTNIAFSGFIKPDANAPLFDMHGQILSRDVRTLLAWIGTELPLGLISPSRLNSLSASTHLVGSFDRLIFDELDVALDTTQLSGSATINLVPAVNSALVLKVSSLDIDSYLPNIGERLASFMNLQGTKVQDENNSLLEWGDSDVYTYVDADIELEVDALIAGGNIFRGISTDLSLEGGSLLIRNARIEDFAGTMVSASGTISDLGTNTLLDDISFRISTNELSRINRTLGLGMPRLPIFDGQITLDANMSGALEDIDIEVFASAGDLKVRTVGSIQNVISMPDFNLEVSLRHPEYIEFMRSIDLGQPPGAQIVGPVDLAGVVSGKKANIRIRDLVAEIGANRIITSISYNRASSRPRLAGAIALANFDFDQLFPPDATQQLARNSRSRSHRDDDAVSARWVREPIDLLGLSSFDATLEVTADHLRIRGLDVDQFEAQLSLDDGVITAEDWQGRFYGGDAVGDFMLRAKPFIDMQLDLSVSDADVGRFGGDLSKPSKASGKVSFNGQFSSSGISQRDLIASLAGQGRFSGLDMGLNSEGQGLAFKTLLAPVRALNLIGGLFTGGSSQGLVTIDTDFSVQEGIFTLSNAALDSHFYAGSFSGTVDLLRWWLNIEGKVSLEANTLAQLAGERFKMPSLVPVIIRGPLDLPSITIDTSSGTAPKQLLELSAPS
ncbi:MAG: AsmA family protein [Rhodospirillaceae bacterium]